MNRFWPFVLSFRARTDGNALSSTRMALAGAALLALAHYTFGEWVFHPSLALWRERVFWTDMPWVAAIPLLNWLAWVVISLGRVNPARSLFLIFAVVFVGDWLWFPVRQYAGLFSVKVSPDYWYWWTHWLPLVFVIGNLVIARAWWMEACGGAVVRLKCQLTWFEVGLRVAAMLLGSWAVMLTLVHLVVPQLPANDFTLDVADEFLVRPEWKGDFEFVLQSASCRGKRLGALMQHLELANLQRNQFYKDLDATTFQQFILSPIVDSLPLAELDWRRTLWENFYRRVRRENEPMSAAQIVVRFLRERVGISPDYPYRVGVETIWTQGMTDEAGFERIYVAALRSVGIAARLNDRKQTELFADGKWQPAPRPLIASL